MHEQDSAAAAQKLVKSPVGLSHCRCPLRVALGTRIVCLINDCPLSVGINVKRLLLTPLGNESSGQADRE